MKLFLPLVIAPLAGWMLASVMLTGCGGHGGGVFGGDRCDRNGHQPLSLRFVSGPQAPPIVDGGSCIISTDLPPDTKNPDEHSASLRHIGESVYSCLNGKASPGSAGAPGFYNDTLWFRINGSCPASPTPGYTYYGCFSNECRTVNTNLGHIGPPSVCPTGTPMDQWTPECWTQFYTVLGHEVTHGWLGDFHERH